MKGTIPVLLRGVAWPAVSAVTTCSVLLGIAGVALIHTLVGPVLLAAAFGLLAAAAAFTRDEPASALVDVTPTGPAQQTVARSLALSVPLVAGLVLVVLTSVRHGGLSGPGLCLALCGNVLLGFVLASSGRRRTGEPGPTAATAIALLLIVPPLFGPIARRVHTFPSSSPPASGLSSNAWWWLVITAGLLTLAAANSRVRLAWPRRPRLLEPAGVGRQGGRPVAGGDPVPPF